MVDHRGQAVAAAVLKNATVDGAACDVHVEVLPAVHHVEVQVHPGQGRCDRVLPHNDIIDPAWVHCPLPRGPPGEDGDDIGAGRARRHSNVDSFDGGSADACRNVVDIDLEAEAFMQAPAS